MRGHQSSKHDCKSQVLIEVAFDKHNLGKNNKCQHTPSFGKRLLRIELQVKPTLPDRHSKVLNQRHLIQIGTSNQKGQTCYIFFVIVFLEFICYLPTP